MTRIPRLVVCVAAMLAGATAVRAQQMPFEDVVRNLRNPDPKVRISAVQLLREARYPEAVTPMAALVNDPVDAIQLEAIAAELSFFLVQDVPAKKRVAFLVEVRTAGQGPAAFEQGPLATLPRNVAPELTNALLQAIDDPTQKVRIEAIYTLGVIAHPPLTDEHAARLIKALDHYDPVIRAAAARVIGRLQVRSAGDALLKAVNDSHAPVRYAAMRALGEVHETRALKALTEQFTYYAKGEGAWAALDALARIADPSSIPLFKAHLNDRDEYLRRASAEGLARLSDSSELAALQTGASTDHSPMARAAMTFAMQKLGDHYMARLVDFMHSDRMVPQIHSYLLELGPEAAAELLPRLQEPEPEIRARVADILGAIGTDTTVAALQPLTKDRDTEVATAATQAIDRIRFGRR